MSTTVHIVCLDCPSPPDYGGAIDMFYKIKALAETGHEVILHYFNYNPLRSPKEIQPYCKAVFSYVRKPAWRSLPLTKPHIVRSRINEELVRRLNRDNHPVLLEGLHCAGIIPLLRNKERVVLRMHNDEAAYYRHLAKTETAFLKRIYFWQESRLLHAYQLQLDKETKTACLSEADQEKLGNVYGFRHLTFLPCFLPWQQVAGQERKGSYCLYHGNLSVSENEEAALWLMGSIFSRLAVPFVIAGKGISPKLAAMAKRYPHVRLVHHPPDDEMQALVRDAHIHVLPSLNSTGVKLKLLNALFNGRHCITNRNGSSGSGIAKGIVVQNTDSGWIEAISSLMQKDFTSAEVEERQAILSLYNNLENARRLSAL